MLPHIFQGDINHIVFLEKVSKIREKKNRRLVSALGSGRIYSSYCEKVQETRVHRDVKWLLEAVITMNCSGHLNIKKSLGRIQKWNNKHHYMLKDTLFLKNITELTHFSCLICYIFFCKGIYGSNLIIMVFCWKLFTEASLRHLRSICLTIVSRPLRSSAEMPRWALNESHWSDNITLYNCFAH